MIRIGLTGGIGTGKSTVASMLAERGAAVVDADEIAREVVSPGGPAYEAVTGRFGPAVLAPDGTVDRAALAALVFSDSGALADLDAITHPVIGAALRERFQALDGPAGETGRPAGAGTGGVAVAVVPLLGPAHVEALRLAGVVVVDCPTEVALGRLVGGRGMDEADARARIAAQAPRADRLALADHVVDNSSTREHLDEGVDALWRWLSGLARHGAATS